MAKRCILDYQNFNESASNVNKYGAVMKAKTNQPENVHAYFIQ